MSSIMTSVSATKGWVVAHNDKDYHTYANPGHTRICGDHICAPFEYNNMKNLLSDGEKQNQTYHFMKQNAVSIQQTLDKNKTEDMPIETQVNFSLNDILVTNYLNYNNLKTS